MPDTQHSLGLETTSRCSWLRALPEIQTLVASPKKSHGTAIVFGRRDFVLGNDEPFVQPLSLVDVARLSLLPMKTPILNMWRSLGGQYSVDLNQDWVNVVIRLAREHYPEEVGTVLVGSYSDDGVRARLTRPAPVTGDSRGMAVDLSWGTKPSRLL